LLEWGYQFEKKKEVAVFGRPSLGVFSDFFFLRGSESGKGKKWRNRKKKDINRRKKCC